ncbi:MAG: hypothetical protein RIT13_563 [Pseudomonadota bacterium]|jgi:hypothetical protein
MTQDEIIEMAQECGLIGMRPHLDGIYIESLLAFAKLVAEAERERIKQANAPEIEKINAYIDHAMRETQRRGQEIEQEPVAWLSTDSIGERYLCFDKPLDNDPVQPLYTAPPQRKPLTHDELADLWYKPSLDWMKFARAIEAAHGIKENT